MRLGGYDQKWFEKIMNKMKVPTDYVTYALEIKELNIDDDNDIPEDILKQLETEVGTKISEVEKFLWKNYIYPHL